MTADELKQFDLENGVLIQSVARNSRASREGLARGMVIYKLDGKAVNSSSDISDYIENLDKGDVVRLQIRWQNRAGNNSDNLVFLQIPNK